MYDLLTELFPGVEVVVKPDETKMLTQVEHDAINAAFDEWVDRRNAGVCVPVRIEYTGCGNAD